MCRTSSRSWSAACSTRSAVSNDGVFRPCSYADNVGRDVLALRATSVWVSRAAFRARPKGLTCSDIRLVYLIGYNRNDITGRRVTLKVQPWFADAGRAHPTGAKLHCMADHFGRPGRRADLGRVLHETLIAHGLSPLEGTARATIDQKIAKVAAELGVSEATALKHFNERLVAESAVNTAHEWHAAQVAEEVAGDLPVAVPATAAGQLVMGLAVAVGQMVREVYGDLPAAVGEPLDALCQLGSALRDATAVDEALPAEVTLQTLTISHRTLRAAAAGVIGGTVPVIVPDSARPQLAAQLNQDAQLALDLQP